jgi:nitroreductase
MDADQLAEVPPPSGSTNSLDGGAPMGRRRFLHVAGLGAGTLAVAGAGGLTWRAVDAGVFATGIGAAYAAWDELSPPGGTAMDLVCAAVLAASAHNAQPWHFAVAPDRIDLFADPSRTLGSMDPLLREMDVSLGCALENLVLAGPPNGLGPTVHLLPDPGDPTHVARVDLAPTAAAASPLFAAVAARHTDRGAYETGRAVSRPQLDALSTLVQEAPNTALVWFTDDAGKQAFGDLTVRATEAIIADEAQSVDDFAWYRSDWGEIQERKDGITIDPSGQTPLIRVLAKLLPVSRRQNNDGWLSGTRDSQVPTAAAFGALVVRDPLDRVQRLEAGRSWQRLHLAATVAGLGVQPLCQVPERIDREVSAGLPPQFGVAMSALLRPGWSPIMTFRIGHPTADALRSPRRPAGDVVLT